MNNLMVYMKKKLSRKLFYYFFLRAFTTGRKDLIINTTGKINSTLRRFA